MKYLSRKERDKLRAQHKLERDRRICDRIKAVLLHDEGWSYEEIAKVLLLSKDSIRNHVAEYKSSTKLKPDGGGSSEKLKLPAVSGARRPSTRTHLPLCQRHFALCPLEMESELHNFWHDRLA